MLNPVLRRESQTSMRSFKTYLAISFYVGIITLVTAIYIFTNRGRSFMYGFDPKSMIVLYAVLAGFQVALILMTVPSLTAGSISGERERQTLDILLITKMSPFSIIIGKLLACLSIVLIMIVATLPVFAIVFYYGGVSLLDLIQITLFLLLIACTTGAASIFFSTMIKKSIVSIVIMYLFIAIVCLGTVLIFGIYSSYIQDYGSDQSTFITYLMLGVNPGIGFMSLIDSQIGSDLVGEFIYSIVYYDSNMVFKTPFWIVNSIINAVFAIIFIAIATLRLHKIQKS